MLRALTFSFLLFPQFSCAQKFFKDMGTGFMGEINYLKLTNDGGKGWGEGGGIFVFFPIGKHLEFKVDIYSETPNINYQFNYTEQDQNYIKHFREEGKEEIDVSPFTFQLNYFPGNQEGFFAGVGYSPRQAQLQRVEGKATYKGTDLSSNQPISGDTYAEGSQVQYPEFGGLYIFGLSDRWTHCGVLNIGYKYKFTRATCRFQYSFSNVIVDDLHIVPGNGLIDYPVQHMMIASITAEIDMVMLIRVLIKQAFPVEPGPKIRP